MHAQNAEATGKVQHRTNLWVQKRLLDPEYARLYREKANERTRKYYAKHRRKLDEDRMVSTLTSLIACVTMLWAHSTYTPEQILGTCLDKIRQEVAHDVSLWDLIRPSRQCKTIGIAVLYHVLTETGLIAPASLEQFLQACKLQYSSFKLVYDEIVDISAGNAHKYMSRVTFGSHGTVEKNTTATEAKSGHTSSDEDAHDAAGRSEAELFGDVTEYSYSAAAPSEKCSDEHARVILMVGGKQQQVLDLEPSKAELVFRIINAL